MSERASKIDKASPVNGGGAVAAPDFTKAATAMVNGWTSLGGQMIKYTQVSFDAGLAAADALRRCMTPQEMVEVQMRFAHDSYERTLDEVCRMGNVVTRMSSEAIDAVTPPAP